MFFVSVHQFLEQNVTPIEKLKAVRGMDMENLKSNPHSEPEIVDSPQVQILAWAPTGCRPSLLPQFPHLTNGEDNKGTLLHGI